MMKFDISFSTEKYVNESFAYTFNKIDYLGSVIYRSVSSDNIF